MSRRNKTLAALGAAVVAATVGLFAQHSLASSQNQPTGTVGTTSTAVRVMDWNIQGGKGRDGRTDFNRTVDVIRSQNPDIVTLQEVHDNGGGDDQPEILKREFPGYYVHYAKSDENALGGQAGNLILSRYPILERLTYLLPQYPSDSNAVRRSLGGARVSVGGTDVRVYTTHLSAGAGAEATIRRQRQAAAVIDKLPASLMHTPMLLTGDMNVRPDDEIRFWYAQADWIDAWTQRAPNIGSDVVTHPGGDTDARIDYVYMTPGFDVSGVHRVDTIASDHLPVVTDLTVRDTKPSKVSTVMAGAQARAGWAHAAVYSNGGAKIRVCDNAADGWGVRGYLYNKATGKLVVSGSDGAYADRCGAFTAPTGSVSSAAIKTCLYRDGRIKDCRQRDVT